MIDSKRSLHCGFCVEPVQYIIRRITPSRLAIGDNVIAAIGGDDVLGRSNEPVALQVVVQDLIPADCDTAAGDRSLNGKRVIVVCRAAKLTGGQPTGAKEPHPVEPGLVIGLHSQELML